MPELTVEMLMKRLRSIKAEHGNIPVRVGSFVGWDFGGPYHIDNPATHVEVIPAESIHPISVLISDGGE